MQEESLCPNRGDPRPVMSPPPEGAVSGTKPDTQHNWDATHTCREKMNKL